jgi:hypothetical protein
MEVVARYRSIAPVLLLPLLMVVGQNATCNRSGATKTSNAQNSTPTMTERRDLRGQWGGADISMTIADDGTQIEFGCAHGHIDEQINPNSEGKFSVKGTYAREHGGPLRGDETQDQQDATYKGTVNGQKMSLSVSLTEGNVDVGTFMLERGKTGRVHKCM